MTIERERQRQAKHAVRVKPADYREILNSSDRTRTCDPGAYESPEKSCFSPRKPRLDGTKIPGNALKNKQNLCRTQVALSWMKRSIGVRDSHGIIISFDNIQNSDPIPESHLPAVCRRLDTSHRTQRHPYPRAGFRFRSYVPRLAAP
jgi:hypothetical protein